MKRVCHAIEDGAILLALGLAPLLWGGLDIGIDTVAEAASDVRRLFALALIFSLMAVASLARLARRLLVPDPDPIVRTGADLPAVALLLWTAVAGIASRYRYASLIEWYRVAAVLLLIWLLANRPAQPRRRAWFAGIVVLAGGVTAAIGVRSWIPEAMINNPVWRVFGGFYSPTVFAAFLVMTIPLAAALALKAREPAYRFLWGFLGLLMTFALYLTGSRGGWLAFAVVGLVFAALLVATSPRRRLLIALGVPALLVLLGGPLLFRPMRERLFPTVQRREQSDAFRVLTWRATARMAADRPVLGSGPGAFQYVFPRYALAGFTRMAHNTYLQMAAEAGVPGLLAFLVLLAACAAAAVRALRRHAAGPDRPLVIAAIAGATGFLVMNLLDYGWYAGGVAFTFGLLLGLLLNASRPDDAPAAPRKRARAGPGRVRPRRLIVFLLALGALVLAALPPGFAAWAAERASQALQSDAEADPAGAITAMREAAAVMPLDAAYTRHLALLYGYPQGIREVQRAIALQPTHALNHMVLAGLYQLGGRPREAADAYRAAVRLNPHYLIARRSLGDLLLQVGETAQAQRTYAGILAFEHGPYAQVQALEARVEPEYAYAHYGLARIAMARARWDEAMGHLTEALRVLDDYDRRTRPLEEKLAGIGERDPAALQALDALRAAALYRMAVCAQRLGGPDSQARASDLRRRAEELAPDVADTVLREGPPWPEPSP